MQILTLDQGFAWIESLTNFERKTPAAREYRLDRMLSVLSVLHNPQRHGKTIHIAGSKGKGSTAAFIAQQLAAIGYRVAVYASPHVLHYRERFQILQKDPNKRLSEDQIDTLLLHIIQKMHHETNSEGGKLSLLQPTTFELLTAAFFCLARETNSDYVVLETGLGGRLDATNVVPQVAAHVCTSIENEHSDILGTGITNIATEKAGIIRSNAPTFIGNIPKQAKIVFDDRCAHFSSKAFHISDHVTIQTEKTKPIAVFHSGLQLNLESKMLGKMQTYNAALASLVVHTLHPEIESDILESGIRNTFLPGRLQAISQHPPIFIDCAHTADSVRNSIQSIQPAMPNGGTAIFGAVEGKNIQAMALEISKFFQKIIVCRPGTFKTSNPQAIADEFCTYLPRENVIIVEDAAQALHTAMANCTSNGTGVLACGSFYLAGLLLNAARHNDLIKDSACR